MGSEERAQPGPQEGGRPPGGVVGRLKHLVRERTVLVLAILFALGGGLLLWHQTHVHASIVKDSALESAKAYSEALAAFRTLYTSEVVEVVRKLDPPVVVTHDLENNPHAIPLSETFTIMLGRAIGAQGSGVQAGLYSPHPFPWRWQEWREKKQRDPFVMKAWKALKQDPATAFHSFEDVDGLASLRYATADLMRASCIDCHNNHEATPKSDWKVGDLRGVLEVTLPVAAADLSTAGLWETLWLVAVFGALGIAVLALVIGRLRRTSRELEGRVHMRTEQLVTSNEELSRSEKELQEAIGRASCRERV